jgi:hypothetical protein
MHVHAKASPDGVLPIRSYIPLMQFYSSSYRSKRKKMSCIAWAGGTEMPLKAAKELKKDIGGSAFRG